MLLRLALALVVCGVVAEGVAAQVKLDAPDPEILAENAVVQATGSATPARPVKVSILNLVGTNSELRCQPVWGTTVDATAGGIWAATSPQLTTPGMYLLICQQPVPGGGTN